MARIKISGDTLKLLETKRQELGAKDYQETLEVLVKEYLESKK